MDAQALEALEPFLTKKLVPGPRATMEQTVDHAARQLEYIAFTFLGFDVTADELRPLIAANQ